MSLYSYKIQIYRIMEYDFKETNMLHVLTANFGKLLILFFFFLSNYWINPSEK